jgi:hypothetical protein
VSTLNVFGRCDSSTTALKPKAWRGGDESNDLQISCHWIRITQCKARCERLCERTACCKLYA